MMYPHRIIAYFAAMLIVVSSACGQETKAPPPSEEDQRLTQIVERWIDENESERDHVAKIVMRNSDGAEDGDFEQWYVRLGGADDGWDRTRIQSRSVREVFDRIARYLSVEGPVILRDQFVNYAQNRWRSDSGVSWRTPSPFNAAAEADRLFRRLDRDRNRYLHLTEMAPALRDELNRWDANEDRWITQEEYRQYFARRIDRFYRNVQQRSEKTLPAMEINIILNSDRPNVPRPGNLPLGLPAWFEQVDEDRDGQIALSEWRFAGWPLDDFSRLDSNDDGFFEPHEILKLLSYKDRAGDRPFAFLMQLRPAKMKSKKED